jgi:hypothetical protein
MKLDWHLVEAGIGAAWAMLGGPADIPWEDVAVGHIDTGFTTNPALGFRADVSDWVDTAADRNFFQKELNPLEGAPPAFATQDSALDNLGGFSGGHGTRTMSVLCGFNETAAAKKGGYDGYYGAAPRVRVIPVRIENTIFIQNTFRESLPAAIHYLVDQGLGVISLSMGAPKFGVLARTRRPKRWATRSTGRTSGESYSAARPATTCPMKRLSFRRAAPAPSRSQGARAT